MHSLIKLTALSLVLTGSSAWAQPSEMRALQDLNRSLEALASNVGPSVVQILASGAVPVTGFVRSTGDIFAEQRGTGSGVILSPNGYIVTNAHVVTGARAVKVVLPERPPNPKLKSILRPIGQIVGAQVVNLDLETDIAVLKIQVDGGDLPYLELADSDELRQGQLVFAFGSPLGLKNSATMGVVSATARQLVAESPMVHIQTDATINPGNSGGPLVDTNGRVVGINTMIFSQSGGSEGIGFAVPSNIVKAVYEQIRETGRVRRGSIGVQAQSVTPLLRQALDLPVPFGAILADVYPDGSGAAAGLKAGDVILSLEGKRMENGRQLQVNLYRQPIGERILMDVLRGSDTLKVSVEILDRPEDPGRFSDFVNPEKNLIPEWGIMALDLNEGLANMFPNLRIRSGVVVASRALDAPFWDDGFLPGDIIHEVNGSSIETLAQLREAIASFEVLDPVAVQVERDGRLSYVAFEFAR